MPSVVLKLFARRTDRKSDDYMLPPLGSTLVTYLVSNKNLEHTGNIFSIQ